MLLELFFNNLERLNVYKTYYFPEAITFQQIVKLKQQYTYLKYHFKHKFLDLSFKMFCVLVYVYLLINLFFINLSLLTSLANF